MNTSQATSSNSFLHYRTTSGMALDRKGILAAHVWAEVRGAGQDAAVVFCGGPDGEHQIWLCVSDEARVLAHWEGYCENAGMAMVAGARVSYHTGNAWRSVTVLATPAQDSMTVRVSGFTWKRGGQAQPRRVRKVDLRFSRGWAL